MSKNLPAKYYQESKGRKKKKACEKFQNLSKKENKKKRQYGRESSQILSEDEKTKQNKNLLNIEKNIIK